MSRNAHGLTAQGAERPEAARVLIFIGSKEKAGIERAAKEMQGRGAAGRTRVSEK